MFALSGFELSETTLEAMFSMADLDGDGLIQIDEAVPYMRCVMMDASHNAPVVMPDLGKVASACEWKRLRVIFRFRSSCSMRI